MNEPKKKTRFEFLSFKKYQGRFKNLRKFLRQLRESINTTIYNSRDRVMFILQIVNALNLIFVLFSLIYSFGFNLSADEVTKIFNRLEISVIIFGLDYLTRLVYEFQRIEYIISNPLESSLMGILLVLLIGNAFGIPLLYDLNLFLQISDYRSFYEALVSTYLILMFVIQIARGSTLLSSIKVKPATTFIASFIILILLGTGFLMMPAMTKEGSTISFLDALFTSTSASCVTGLIVVDTATFFTFKGQLVLLVLIQLGGIGIVSFASFFATFLSQGVGIKQQAIIQDVLSSESLSSAKDMLKRVVWLTASIEITGAIAIFFTWGDNVHFDSFGQKLFFSIFHSISAFCNAGFSLFSGGLYEGAVASAENPYPLPIHMSYVMHLVICMIIILGSLGFSTIEDILSPQKLRERLEQPWREWSLGTQIAVNMTIVLVVLGTIGFYFIEIRKGGLLEGKGFMESMVISFFQSVTTRTAGFNTVDFSMLAPTTIIMMIFFMFIGAAPGSTGGGIKTSTFLLLVISSLASIRNKKTVEIGKRSISNEIISRAFSIVAFAITYNFVCFFILSLTQPIGENGVTVLNLFFEQISAFATVGLSMGITGNLTDASKIVLIVTMYIGRVGTLTLALALSKRVISNSYEYPSAHIMVG